MSRGPPLPSGPTEVIVPEPSISSHRLDNGLILVAETIPTVRSAAFTFLLPAGAAFEAADRGGTASMLAEWITRGAGGLDSRELIGALDSLGVSHSEGAQTAHTTLSAATLGRNLIPALGLFADVVRRPALDDDEIEPIRALAVQSLQSLEDDPGTKVVYELRRRHYPDPWGRPAIGSIQGVESASPDDLRAFHAANYRPNGAILAIAGAIDWDELREAVARLYGDWERRLDPTIQVKPAGPRRDHIVKETQQTQIALAYPSVTIHHPDYYLARAATAILGGYSSARLFTEVREKRGLCYTVYASYEAHKDRAAVVGYAGTSTDRAQETLDVTLEEIARLSDTGVEAEELDTMRAGLKSSLIMQQESSMGRSSSLATDWYHLGRVRPLDEVSAALDALTPEAVSDFAARQETRDLTLLTLGPTPLKLPPES
jgi:predicted Zn-dependent peptidase